MPRLDSTRYTIIFATTVCVVCAPLVAVAAVSRCRARRPTRALQGKERPRWPRASSRPDRTFPRANWRRLRHQIKARPARLQTGELVPADSRRAGLRRAQGAQRPGCKSRRAGQRRRIGRLPPTDRLPLRRSTWSTSSSSRSRALGCGDGLRVCVARARRQYRARPDLLRPEGNAGPGRGDLQPASWLALWLGRKAFDALGAEDHGHQGMGGSPSRSAAGRRTVRRDRDQQRGLAPDAVLAVGQRLRHVPGAAPRKSAGDMGAVHTFRKRGPVVLFDPVIRYNPIACRCSASAPRSR